MARYYYQQEVTHPGLNKYRVVKAYTKRELNEKVDALTKQWDEQWQRKLLQEQKRVERETAAFNAEVGMQTAALETEEAQNIQNALDNILKNSINTEEMDFSSLKSNIPFPVPEPGKPSLLPIPREPQRSDDEYNPTPSFFTKISKNKMAAFEEENTANFAKKHLEWVQQKKRIGEENDAIFAKYHSELDRWQNVKADYYAKQRAHNQEVDDYINGFKNGDPNATAFLYERAIDSLRFPIPFDTDSEVAYNPDTKMLIVDLYLPSQNEIPNLKSVTYIKSKAQYKESFFTESYLKKKYDGVIYQIVLRVLKCVFTINNRVNNIESCVLNGKVSTIDKTTGQPIEPYILSVNVSKDDFNSLNLNAIDPKAWFKKSKGVSAASIADITPIAPLINMNREDSRFIEGYNVEEFIDESSNLAAMDWQDFENLIRELFEEEFRSSGGEVKITQASRDGGVDAVAFDPDPIRGGKIVIQAKRYTNVVGVSAVRDLYGTVLNEGATKGILVTTSNYGNDAYKFAQDKPLTLLNGAELLYLLEKHGHKARIDIHEAKMQAKAS